MIENSVEKLNGPIQLRGGTAADLTSVNLLPARREIVVEVDTGRIKVGDGVRKWNELPYSFGITEANIATKQEIENMLSEVWD